MRRRCVAVVLTVMTAQVAPHAAEAQSGSVFERALLPLRSVRQYVSSESAPASLSLPRNVVVPERFGQLLDTMLYGSPTFRRQCVRIAGEPYLTVHLRLAPVSWPSSLRAMTQVERESNGHITARIVIADVDDFVELIAHEFEHVIEQMDGVDLPALASLPRTGVHRQRAAADYFETDRAAHAGRKVVRELHR